MKKMTTKIPFSAKCPITLCLIKDPVMTCDGQTYERAAIEQWFKSGKKISPITGLPLKNTNLIPNILLKSLIEELELKEETVTTTLSKVKESDFLLLINRQDVITKFVMVDSKEICSNIIKELETLFKVKRVFLFQHHNIVPHVVIRPDEFVYANNTYYWRSIEHPCLILHTKKDIIPVDYCEFKTINDLMMYFDKDCSSCFLKIGHVDYQPLTHDLLLNNYWHGQELWIF